VDVEIIQNNNNYSIRRVILDEVEMLPLQGHYFSTKTIIPFFGTLQIETDRGDLDLPVGITYTIEPKTTYKIFNKSNLQKAIYFEILGY
jgi:hypothetical protein